MRKEAKTYIVYIFPFFCVKRRKIIQTLYTEIELVSNFYMKKMFSAWKKLSYSLLALYITEKIERNWPFDVQQVERYISEIKIDFKEREKKLINQS